MMGCELRLEALPVILAAYPETDPNLALELLRLIHVTIAKSKQ